MSPQSILEFPFLRKEMLCMVETEMAAKQFAKAAQKKPSR